MKLHVSASLRRAIMACYAVAAVLTPTLSTATIAAGVFAVSMAAPAQAAATAMDDTTTINNASGSGIDIIFAGAVADYVAPESGNQFHDSSFTQVGTTDKGTTVTTSWYDFCSANSNATYGKTLRLGSITSAQTVFTEFGPFSLGGLIVEASSETAAAYTLGRNNDATVLQLIAAEGKDVNLTIGTNTTLLAKELKVKNNGSWYVASGKTLTIQTRDSGSSEIESGKKVTIKNIGGGTGTVSLTHKLKLAQDASLTLEAGTSFSAPSIELTGTGSTLTIKNSNTITAMTAAAGSAIDVESTGALTLAGTTDLAGTLTNNGALTLGGTVKLKTSIVNNGTMTLDTTSALTLDLTALTFTEEEQENGKSRFSATLFTGSGTSPALNVNDTNLNILLQGGTLGRTALSYENGVLSYVQLADSLTFGDSTLDWETGVTLDNGAVFSNDDADFVTFTGNTTATLTGPINSAGVTVAEGASLTLTNNGDSANTLTSTGILVIGSLTINDNLLAAGTCLSKESTGTVTLDLGTDAMNTSSFELGYTGELLIASGILNATEERHNNQTSGFFSGLEVKDGGQLNLGNRSVTGDIILSGKGLAGAAEDSTDYGALRMNGSTLRASGSVTAIGDTAIVSNGNSYIQAPIDGHGTLTVNAGNGSLILEGLIPHSGSLVVASGTLSFGNNSSTHVNNAALSDITIKDEATVRLLNKGMQNNADILLEGGTLYCDELGGSSTVAFDELHVKGEGSKIQYRSKGTLSFTRLTGDKDLSIYMDDRNSTGQRTIINTVENYHGTVSVTGKDASKLDYYHLRIGSVHQAENNEMRVTGIKVESDNFSMSGSGAFHADAGLEVSGAMSMNGGTLTTTTLTAGKSFSISDGSLTATTVNAGNSFTMLGGTLTATTLNLSGLLDMYHGGTLSASTLTVANGTVLRYDSATGKELITISSLAENSKVIVDVSAILSSLNDEAGINLGLATAGVQESQIDISTLGGTGTLSAHEGYWYLKGVPSAVSTLWDSNWGAAALAGQPTELTPVPELTGITGEGDTVDYVALAELAAYHPADSKTSAILITGTKTAGVTSVFGGKDRNAGGEHTVTLDSWIKVTGGDLRLIVGGNQCNDGTGRVDFVGDSHIYLAKGGTSAPQVDHIIGGNYGDGAHAGFTGSSYITVETDSVRGSIIGASTSPYNGQTSFTGSSHIYIYAPQTYTGDTFEMAGAGKEQSIVGGFVKYGNDSGSHTFGGDTNIVLDFEGYTDTATMSKDIIVGSIRNTGTVTHNGDLNLTIRNATTTTFTGFIVGGSAVGGATGDMKGIANIDISSGTFDGVVIAGNYDLSGATTLTLGGVNMKLSGGTFNKRITGGNYDTGDGNYDNNWTLGDINITVSGNAVLTKNLLGGSIANRNKADKTYQQGNITIDLQGGTLLGNIYAGGHQNGSSKMQTQSTTVMLSSSVVLGSAEAPITVSGGYQFGDGKSGSTVTGDRTLVFTDTAAYENLANVSFTDFDVVEVAAGGSVTAPLTLSGDTGLKKTGKGELTITGNHTATGTLMVSEGSLLLGTEAASATWGSNITVSAGATLAVVSGSVGSADSALANYGTLILGKEHTLNGQLTNYGTTVVQGGSLKEALTGGTVSIDAQAGTTASTNTLDLAGTDGAAINGGLTFAANSNLTGVTGTIITNSTNTLKLTPTAATCGDTSTPASGHYAIINGADLVLGEQSLTLAGSLADMVKNTDANGFCYLYLTYGTLTATDVNNLLATDHDDRFSIVRIENGALKVSVEAAGIYLATDDSNNSLTGYNSLDGYDGVSVSEGVTLTITLDGAPATAQDAFEIKNLNGGSVAIVNSATDGSVAEVELSNGKNTTVTGSITDGHTANGGGANITKTGEGTLDVAGAVSANSLTVEEGTLKASSVSANSVTVESTGSLSVSGNFESAEAISMQGGTVEFTGANPVTIEGLNGYGSISKGDIVVNGKQTANFDGAISGGTHITVNGNKQNFGLIEAGENDSRGSIIVAGSTGFDLTGMAPTLTLDTLTLKNGSHTVFSNNTYSRALQGGLDLNELIIEDGAQVTIHSEGPAATGDIEICLGTVDTLKATNGSYDVALSGATFLRYEGGTIRESNDQLWLSIKQVENRFMTVASDANSQTGAELLWNVDGSALTPGTELHDVWESLSNTMLAGDDSKVNEALAAIAGASTAVIGSAFSGDVERQLKAIRNRTTTMGVDQEVVNDLPYFNAWINAEGNYHTMDADGNLPGFTLSSWGGTVGMDVDCSDKLTAGLAVTAMYGDLEADSADTAEGDLDTYYVSAFARYNSKRWVHTFVATVGRMDATLDRTVNYGSGSYETQGETEGLGFGLMYEVGYTIPADEEGYTCWQPVFNIAWRHVDVDAYDEEGSDAGLAVGEQSMDAVTIGAGARMQSVVGENLWNRYSIFEARALLKVDAGDRESVADVALLSGSPTGAVNSAERGAVGVELGIGLSIPLSADSGSIFFDASADIRSGETEVNATAGYRINF